MKCCKITFEWEGFSDRPTETYRLAEYWGVTLQALSIALGEPVHEDDFPVRAQAGPYDIYVHDGPGVDYPITRVGKDLLKVKANSAVHIHEKRGRWVRVHPENEWWISALQLLGEKDG